MTLGECVLSKIVTDNTCTCTAFLSHPPEEECDTTVYMGTWVEYDLNNVFAPPYGPVPTHPYLRDLRKGKFTSVCRYSELTSESKQLYDDVLCLAQDQWGRFDEVLELFLVDAGLPRNVAREIRDHPDTLGLQYVCT